MFKLPWASSPAWCPERKHNWRCVGAVSSVITMTHRTGQGISNAEHSLYIKDGLQFWSPFVSILVVAQQTARSTLWRHSEHMTSFTRDTPIIRGTLVITVKHKCFSGLVEQRERALVCLLNFGFKRLNQIRGFVSSVRRLKVINESHVRVYETPLRSYTLL